MKVVALISGGKDSCYNMMQCVAEGHDIIALANLKPKDKDELDSYMYQSVGHHAIDLYAEAMDLPLYRREITGTSLVTHRDYTPTPTDEVEDLFELLKTVQEEKDIQGVAVGAILSNYQRVRMENVCLRLGLVSLAYLWRRDQIELLDEMIQCKVHAILIKVATLGLNPNLHLGKSLQEMQQHLLKKNTEFDLNVCGEGGEYETFTLDCPLFKKYIVLDTVEKVLHSDDAFAPVGYLNIKKAHLVDKHLKEGVSRSDLIKHLPMKRSESLLRDLFGETEDWNNLVHEKLTSKHTYKIPASLNPRLLVKKDVVNDGCHMWLSNLCAYTQPGLDIESQVQDVMNTLQDMVRSCGEGWTLANIVIVHLYVHNMQHFTAINSVYRTHFGLNPAARVCVQAALPENVSVMLDCYGYSCLDNRETMHVQGMSHWAPANIGPYSQCVKMGERMYIAGQIPMVPANLAIVEGGIQSQARLSLQHAERIIEAMSPGCSINHATSCVCYITHPDYISTAKQEWHTVISKEVDVGQLYVVVPELPKGALIEWQVIATVSSCQDCKVSRRIVSADGMQCTAMLIYSDSHNEDDTDSVNSDEGAVEHRCRSITACVYAEDGSTCDNMDATSAMELLCRCCNDVKKTVHLNEISRTSSRIFYPACVFKYELLYEAALQRFDEQPFVLVPVIALETDKLILAMCQ